MFEKHGFRGISTSLVFYILYGHIVTSAVGDWLYTYRYMKSEPGIFLPVGTE